MRRSLAVALAVLLLAGAGLSAQAAEAGGGYYDLGVFAYESKDYQSAESLFKKALETDPANPVYLQYLGRVHTEQGRYEEARENLEAAWDKDPDLSGLNYDLGLLYYHTEQYGTAAEHFAAGAGEDDSNVLAAYYGGICLYRQKRYGEAAPLFEKAAERSPSLKVNSTYYAGICNYQTGNTGAAKEQFTYVKDNADTSAEKRNAEKWLGILGAEPAQKPYYLDFALQYIYDDNVPLDPTDMDLFPSDEADSGVYARAGGRYNIVNRSDLVLGAGIERGQNWYFDLDQFDMSDTSADLYGTYSSGSLLFGLNYIPRLYTLDDEDYLLQHQLRPSVFWQPNRNLLTRFVYSYYLRDYRQNDDRDGSLHDLYADVYYHVFGGRGFVFGGVGYETSTADVSAYDYTRPKLKAGISMELGWRLIMDLELYYYHKEYPNFPGETRKDDKFSGIAALKRPVYRDWLFVTLEYNHITNHSNIEEYDYRRNSLGMGLELEF